MSLIHLEKQGEGWRSRVEGHFILGVHPIETVRKGLPEAMAQAVVDHCVMSGDDPAVFAKRLAAEIEALAPAAASSVLIAAVEAVVPSEEDHRQRIETMNAASAPLEPRRARVPRKATVVAPEAERVPVALPEPRQGDV